MEILLKPFFIIEPIVWIKNVWYNKDNKILWNCWNKSDLAHKDPEVDVDMLGDEKLLDVLNYDISQPSIYNEKIDSILKDLIVNQDIANIKEPDNEDILKIQRHL